MQMARHAALSERFLFYWAKLHSQQLGAGEDYGKLRPTISILFLEDVLFPDVPNVHHSFGVRSARGGLTSDNLSIHLIELPKFEKSVAELSGALDSWLFFLKNTDALDAGKLATSLKMPESREAVEVLTVLTHDDLERERYEAREKARLIRLTIEREQDRLQQATSQAREELKQTEEALAKTAETLEKTESELREAREQTRRELMKRIELYQRLLPSEELGESSLDTMTEPELHRLAEELENRLS